MIQIPYFKSEEIEEIINNKKDLVNYFKNNNINENLMNNNFGDIEDYEDKYEYEDEEMEEEREEEGMEENDVENMSDKEKVKLAYEILSMTSYEDEFFIGILGRLRKVMRS
jgi:hypothetical protein